MKVLFFLTSTIGINTEMDCGHTVHLILFDPKARSLFQHELKKLPAVISSEEDLDFSLRADKLNREEFFSDPLRQSDFRQGQSAPFWRSLNDSNAKDSIMLCTWNQKFHLPVLTRMCGDVFKVPAIHRNVLDMQQCALLQLWEKIPDIGGSFSMKSMLHAYGLEQELDKPKINHLWAIFSKFYYPS